MRVQLIKYLFSSLNFILGINRPQYSEGFGQTCVQAIYILCYVGKVMEPE